KLCAEGIERNTELWGKGFGSQLVTRTYQDLPSGFRREARADSRHPMVAADVSRLTSQKIKDQSRLTSDLRRLLRDIESTLGLEGGWRVRRGDLGWCFAVVSLICGRCHF